MTQQMLLELHAYMVAELVCEDEFGPVAAAKLTLARLARMSTQEQDALHTEYRKKYPSLGGL